MQKHSDGRDMSGPLPHLYTLLRDTLDEVVDSAELVIIGNSEAEFRTLFEHFPAHKTLLDLVGFMDTVSSERMHGICW